MVSTHEQSPAPTPEVDEIFMEVLFLQREKDFIRNEAINAMLRTNNGILLQHMFKRNKELRDANQENEAELYQHGFATSFLYKYIECKEIGKKPLTAVSQEDLLRASKKIDADLRQNASIREMSARDPQIYIDARIHDTLEYPLNDLYETLSLESSIDPNIDRVYERRAEYTDFEELMQGIAVVNKEAKRENGRLKASLQEGISTIAYLFEARGTVQSS